MAVKLLDLRGPRVGNSNGVVQQVPSIGGQKQQHVTLWCLISGSHAPNMDKNWYDERIFLSIEFSDSQLLRAFLSCL